MNNLLQALMYFFERIQTDQPILPNDEQIALDLKEMGFPMDKLHDTISHIQEWSDSEELIKEYPLQPHSGTRVFEPFEAARLTQKAQNIILVLERTGILTPETREQIIDQAVHLEAHPVYPAHIKWIALMVLSKQSDKIPAAYMERLMLHEKKELPH
jgi:Smg protein